MGLREAPEASRRDWPLHERTASAGRRPALRPGGAAPVPHRERGLCRLGLRGLRRVGAARSHLPLDLAPGLPAPVEPGRVSLQGQRSQSGNLAPHGDGAPGPGRKPARTTWPQIDAKSSYVSAKTGGLSRLPGRDAEDQPGIQPGPPGGMDRGGPGPPRHLEQLLPGVAGQPGADDGPGRRASSRKWPPGARPRPGFWARAGRRT